MKKLLILGAGTAGTMMANHLRKAVGRNEWKITVVDQDAKHYYQPGFLFLPFGIYSEADVVKPKRRFLPGGVDYVEDKIVSWDEKEVPYDLLVTVPTNMGDAAIERSGLGDELNYIPTDRKTLQSKAHPNIFVIGDATDVPTSKAGSVAHFEAEVLTENIRHYMKGEPLRSEFDGHANCFIESGHGKGFLLDFNYHLEPVPGKFPVPGLGPFSLLGESRLNHLGKLAFKWVYWHLLLKAVPLPLMEHKMSYAGKQIPASVMKPEVAILPHLTLN